MFKIGGVEYCLRGYEFGTMPSWFPGRHRPPQRRMAARLIDILPAVGVNEAPS